MSCEPASKSLKGHTEGQVDGQAVGDRPYPKTIVAAACYNEHVKIDQLLNRFPLQRPYDILLVDDGSTDDTVARIRNYSHIKLISHETNRGVGVALRTINQFALKNGYDLVVHMAGNNKDDPLLIPSLLKPIIEDRVDFVQGSRYIGGGGHGNMPRYRLVATRFIHPWLFSLITKTTVTDSTSGFRAFRTRLLRDPRIDLEQDWLNQYELEPYFLYKVITLGYRFREVPVIRIYPPKQLGYTKMKAVVGWWSILRPLIFLGLGLKK